jgi:hypothetical protein
MKRRVFLLLTALVVPILAQSNPPTVSLGLDGAKIFALGPVGYAATTSQEGRQFKAIMALKPDKAKQELERLYSSGNPQAMSYALVGMRKFDRTRYAELLVSARAADLTVRTMSGCIISDEKLRTVADELDSGRYDPWLPLTYKLVR